MRFKIVGIGEYEEYGFKFDMWTLFLLGTGRFIVIEYDNEIGWFPMCGENRFKNKHEAQIAIKERVEFEEYITSLDGSDTDEANEFDGMDIFELEKALTKALNEI